MYGCTAANRTCTGWLKPKINLCKVELRREKSSDANTAPQCTHHHNGAKWSMCGHAAGTLIPHLINAYEPASPHCASDRQCHMELQKSAFGFYRLEAEQRDSHYHPQVQDATDHFALRSHG